MQTSVVTITTTTDNIGRNRSQILNDSRLVMLLSLPNMMAWQCAETLMDIWGTLVQTWIWQACMFRSASLFIGTSFTVAVFTIFATSNVDSIVGIPHKIYPMQRILNHTKSQSLCLMCPSAPRVCSEPGGQKPVLSLSLDFIHWIQELSRGWRYSWTSADRRCSNYIWVINKFIAYWNATYIGGLTVYLHGITVMICIICNSTM